ncbi:protein translocase subunit SecD [bacterium]|nr:protein translocase subunit SecD [bacterium]
MQPKQLRRRLVIIVLLAAIAIALVLPREDRILRAIGIKNLTPKVKLGLDLQGGTSLTYEADLNDTPTEERSKAMEGVLNVITKRVNPTGTSEAVIQQSGQNRIVVQLPGVTDAQAAADQIGRTAQLSFYSLSGDEQPVPEQTDLTGKDLEQATADIDPQTATPIIRFNMKSGDATKKFSELTTKINQSGGRLVIVLDNEVLFNGTVSTPITDGVGQMTGFEDVQTAKETAVLLNAGALPVPVALSSQQTIGATLGSESIARSMIAGVIGIVAVMLFMIFSYRWAGVIASAALTLYALFNIVIFKLASITPWPIVLTLAGIAGFVLSVGMAVDANILIFERMKEEMRSGKTVHTAMITGFKRAWSSIRDSNISTLLTCLILYTFGAPIIKGFAVTLALGVMISMVTAITISRTFLQLFADTKFGSNPKRYSNIPVEHTGKEAVS